MQHEEFREATASLRHYSSLRFAGLALFSGANAGFAAAVFSDHFDGASLGFKVACCVCAILVALLFLRIEIAITAYIRCLFEFGKENKTGYLAYLASEAPKHRLAMRRIYCAFYGGAILFWLYAIGLILLVPPPAPHGGDPQNNRAHEVDAKLR